METQYDVIVLGAGPAGLTAGIYLARARVKTLVLDSGSAGGQVILSHQIANYPGAPEISGSQLARTMLKQARSFGCTVLTQAQVTGLELAGPQKRVQVEGEGEFRARAVILATGGRSRTLGLDSELRLRGKGISYCATCDGDFFTGKEIVAIGGGNTALEEAVSLTKYASKVTIIHQFDQFQAQAWAVDEARANPKIQFLLEQEVRDFEGGDSLEAVVSVHKRTGQVTRTPAAGAFVFIGYIPNTETLRGQVDLNAHGEILSDEHLATNLPGVFAAGDCRVKRHRQITTAVSDGTIAAISATDYLQGRS